MERVQIRRTRQGNRTARTDHETVQSQCSGILISKGGVGRGCSVHRVGPGGNLLLPFLAVRILEQ